jgi:shikimate dehydrogenase
MSDSYCVFGNPVAHSKSPAIHRRFAAAAGQAMTYEAICAPLDAFAASVRAFIEGGGRGANVTVPFKEEAFRLCQRLSQRAERAGAVNTLIFNDHEIVGDNTDGAGLVRDITHNLGFALAGKRILLLGAGGAARGVIKPLLDASPERLFIANRSPEKAVALAASFVDLAAVGDGLRPSINGGKMAEITGKCFDLVINATSASLAGVSLPLPEAIFSPASLAYDMMYGKGETLFLQQARRQGASRCADGLGMLVEQAAEAFALWRGVVPESAPVLAELRSQLAA